jgi:hypothetical protein
MKLTAWSGGHTTAQLAIKHDCDADESYARLEVQLMDGVVSGTCFAACME